MTKLATKAVGVSLFWALSLFGAWGNPLPEEAVRIGIVREAGSGEIQTLGDLLEVGLSTDPHIQLLDRREVDRIFAEHELQMVFEANGIQARRQLGELLRADLLVCLHSGIMGEKKAIFVSVADVRSGLRLARHVFAASPELEEGVAPCLEAIRLALEKWREPPEQVVAVTPFLSRDLGHQYAHLSETFRWMVETILDHYPGYYVVEWDEARAYLAEVQLSPSRGELFQHALPWFITGEYRNDGVGEQRKVGLQLQFDRDGVKTAASLDVPADQVRGHLEQVLRDQMASKAVPIPAMESNAFKEATYYWTRAHDFMDLGQYRTALSLFEAALLVVPRDITLDFNGWVYSVDRQVHDFPVSPPDILYCKLIQVITLILRRGDPVDDVALANTYLGDWMRSRITAHRSSPRYFYELKDAAILHGAGIPETFARSRMIYEMYEWMDGAPERRVYAKKGFRDVALNYYWRPSGLFQDPELTMSYARDLARIYGFLLKHPGGKDKVWESVSQHVLVEGYPVGLREELIQQVANIMPTNEYRVFAALLPIEARMRGKTNMQADDSPQWRELMAGLRPDVEKLSDAMRDLYGEDLTPRLHNWWDVSAQKDGLLQMCGMVLSRIPWEEAQLPPLHPDASTYVPPKVEEPPLADHMRIEPYDLVNNWGRTVTNTPVLEVNRLPIQPQPAPTRALLSSGISSWRKMPGGKDVVVQQNHLVQVMERADELVDLYDAWTETPGARILDAVYDGSRYWIFQCTADGAEFQVLVLDSRGHEESRIQSPAGVPFCQRGRAAPLSAGQVLWAGNATMGGIAQTWLAVMTANPSDIRVDVFHEAKIQWLSVARREEGLSSDQVAFTPDCLEVFHTNGIAMAVVGSRYGRFLLLDCDRRKVIRTLSNFKASSEYICDGRNIYCFNRHNSMRRLALDSFDVQFRSYRKWADSLSEIRSSIGILDEFIIYDGIRLLNPEDRVHYLYRLPKGSPRVVHFYQSNFYDLIMYCRGPDTLYSVSCRERLNKEQSKIFDQRPEWIKVFEMESGGQVGGYGIIEPTGD